MDGKNEVKRKRRGRGEGSVYQRKDGLWVASVSAGYHHNGTRKRKTVYAKTKKEVLDKLRKTDPNAKPSKRLTVSVFVDNWITNTIQRSIARSTADKYRRMLNRQIVPYLNMQLSALEIDHLEFWLQEMTNDEFSNDAQSKALSLVRTALNDAVRRKYLAHNVAKDVKPPRIERKKFETLTQGQVDVFLSKAKENRLYAVYALALGTGMRQGEILGLQWTDVDFDAKTVHIRRSLENVRGQLQIKDVKTKASYRTISLPTLVINALHEHRKRLLVAGLRSEYVFINTRGNWIQSSWLSILTKKILANAGLPHIRFHDLRHTHATLLIEAGQPIKAVSERLGHANITITLSIYAHVTKKMEHNLAATFDKLIGCS